MHEWHALVKLHEWHALVNQLAEWHALVNQLAGHIRMYSLYAEEVDCPA